MTETAEPLSPDRSGHLAEFARACKSAARVVALYPPTHPAIPHALARIVDAASTLRPSGSLALTVFPHALLLDGRAAQRADPSVAELAELLHAHLVGELSLHDELTPSAWHTFLSLLARPYVELQEGGGLARAWQVSGAGAAALEIKLIDYTEVLRERELGTRGDWDRIVTDYLENELSEQDEQKMIALLEIAEDQSKLTALTEQLMKEVEGDGVKVKPDLVGRLLHVLADFVARARPEQLDSILHHIAATIPGLTPEVVTHLVGEVPGGHAGGIDLSGEVRARVTDECAADFVANSVTRDPGATARLAAAFQTLVPEPTRRARSLELAEQALEPTPFGQQPEFPDLWKRVQEMLTSYSDAAYVSHEYGRELPVARATAIDVERGSGDPPERVGRWLLSVADDALRRLDQQLLVDLIRIEERPEPWAQVLSTAAQRVDHLVLMGDIEPAERLLGTIVEASEGGIVADHAQRELAALRSGPLLRNIVLFVRDARESDVKLAGSFCDALGPSVIPTLVEALSQEQNSVTVRRLREVLLGFGAAGRPYADALRLSPNPAVRRTAIELLRVAAGTQGLQMLAALVDDPDSAVQRDAIKALVQAGTGGAHTTLERVITAGSTRTREAVIQVLVSTKDERTAPLLAHIVRHSDYHGSAEGTYVSAVHALGRIAGDDRNAIDALSTVLARGEWWAPRRTGRLREAAAQALRDAASGAARAALQKASASARPGARRAARAALASVDAGRRVS